MAEVSLVTFEADTNAKVTSVKSATEDAKTIEGLVELGHSHEDAVKAMKELSLEKEEPLEQHSEDQAGTEDESEEDILEDGSEEEKKSREKGLKSLMHSLKSVNEKY